MPTEKNVLIVLDHLDFNAHQMGRILEPGKSYYLLTFGVSATQALHIETVSHLPITPLDTRELSLAAEQETRDCFLNLLKDFPHQKLSDTQTVSSLLTYRKRNLWWYLFISQKDIWGDRLVNRLYALLRLHKVLSQRSYQEILLFIKDSSLRRTIVQRFEKDRIKFSSSTEKTARSDFTHNFYFSAICKSLHLLTQLCVLKLLGLKTLNELPAKGIGFFSLYPAWWQAPFSAQAEELFFRDLPLELAKRQPVGMLIWLKSGWLRMLKERKAVRKFFSTRPSLILQSRLRPGDLAIFFDRNLFHKLGSLLNCSAKLSLAVQGFNIIPLFMEDLYASINNHSLFEWLLLDRALGRTNLQSLSALFYRLEFQPPESALLYNTDAKTTTFGFQHSALGKNFLNYVFLPNELRSTSMPLPDHILTSGMLGMEYFTRAGYPADRLKIAGGIRIGKLHNYIRNLASKHDLRTKYQMPLKKKIIFVPASIVWNETYAMLHDLVAALNQLGREYHIIFKNNYKIYRDPRFTGKVFQLFEKLAPGISFTLSVGNIPFHDLIALADAVCLTGGSAALEAMILGVMPIVYEAHPQFSHNPMVDYPEAVFIVDNAESMLAALKKLEDKDAVNQLKSNWKKPIEDMFSDIMVRDPRSKFQDIIKERIKINE